MLTWMDIGNGWRNLYLLSFAVQALALGTGFAAHRWIGRSRVASFLVGGSVTPFVQFLWMLLMGAAWPHAPRLLLIAALPALSAISLLAWLWRRRKRLPALLRQGVRRVLRWFAMDRGGALCFTLAAALTTILLPICVRLCIQNNNTYTDAGEYLAMAEEYCKERDLGALISKDDGDGRFRPNSHFPSMELTFAYGLMHAPEGECGYPYDKPVFTGIGLLFFCMAASLLAAVWVFTRGKPRWVCLGVLLLNLVPDLFSASAGAPRDIFRLLATLTAFLGLYSLSPSGGWKAYCGKALLMLVLCFTCMSAHVVMFVVLPFLVVAWVLHRFVEALARHEKPWRTLLRSVGLALFGAAGTVAAFWGNVQCYLRSGEMSPFRLMTTYTDARWFPLYEQFEYRSTEAGTTVDFLHSFNDVLMRLQTPLGVWGFALAMIVVCAVVIALIVRRHKAPLSQSSLNVGYCAIALLLTLLPMTGLIDTKVYSFSGAFLKLTRYTMQWFLLCIPLLTCALSWCEEQWPKLRLDRRVKKPAARRLLRMAPALLGVVVCACSFAQGVSQQGYDSSFFRDSRNLLEDESYLLDNGFRERYGTLLKLAPLVDADAKIVYTNKGEQYPLHGRGYSLTSNPMVSLMVAADLPQALAEQNIALIVTDQDYWDNRYFAASDLSDYLNALPEGQIVEDDTMRFYILDPTLAKRFAALD